VVVLATQHEAVLHEIISQCVVERMGLVAIHQSKYTGRFNLIPLNQGIKKSEYKDIEDFFSAAFDKDVVDIELNSDHKMIIVG